MYTSYLAKNAEHNSPSFELMGGGRHCFCALSAIHHAALNPDRNKAQRWRLAAAMDGMAFLGPKIVVKGR